MVTASRVYDDTYYSWEVTARVDADDDTNWQGPAAKGILGHEDWQQDYGTDYDDGTNNPVLSNASRLYVNTGWWLSPAANFSASLKSCMFLYKNVPFSPNFCKEISKKGLLLSIPVYGRPKSIIYFDNLPVPQAISKTGPLHFFA